MVLWFAFIWVDCLIFDVDRYETVQFQRAWLAYLHCEFENRELHTLIVLAPEALLVLYFVLLIPDR